MEKIEAYKCGFCDKVYENPQSCRSHEYRCYFNPKTKSCASCAFSVLDETRRKLGHTVRFRACKVNFDISKKMRTKCEKYLNKKYLDDPDIMNIVNSEYNHDKFSAEAIASIEEIIHRL